MRILLLFIFALSTQITFAQWYTLAYQANAGNPGALNVQNDDDLTGWLAMTNLVVNSNANAWSDARAIPFAFQYFGNAVTTVRATYHGLLSFGTPTFIPGGNVTLPTLNLEDRTIACFWDEFASDGLTGADDYVMTQTFGTAPNRQFWIRWSNMEYGNPSSNLDNSFAVVLEETSNNIYLVDMRANNAANLSTSLGLQNTSTCGAAWMLDQVQPDATNTTLPTDNDYYQFSPVGTLAGTYTVGGAASDFPALSNGAALLGCGISGAVEFSVQTGTYQEQVRLPIIPGVSAADTVWIHSQSGDSTDVVYSWPSTNTFGNNFTLQMNGADYVTIQGMTFERTGTNLYGGVIEVNNQSENARFLRNQILGINGVATANRDLFLGSFLPNGLEILQNYFNGGSKGISLSGTTGYSPQVIIAGNKLENCYSQSVELSFLLSPVVGLNEVTSTAGSPTHTGYYLNSMQGPLYFAGNKSDVTGIGASFLGNINVTGIPSEVNNNMLKGSTTGLRLATTSLINFYFNSIQSSGAAGSALSIQAGVQDISAQNNLLRSANATLGYVMNVVSATPLNTIFPASDFNGFSIAGGAAYIVYNGLGLNDLCAWQVATGFDANSNSFDPEFDLANGLYAQSPLLQSAGTPIATIPLDIDLQTRSVTAPSQGANEISAPTCTPLAAGTYVIGACGDYRSFNEAAAILNTCGVAGAVVFEVLAGTYNEQVSLGVIPGASAVNTVSFRSQAADSSTVILSWASTAAGGDNYVLDLDGTEFVTWEDMTLYRTGNLAEGTVLQVQGAANNNSFLRIHFLGGGQNVTSASLIQANNSEVSGLDIQNCQLQGGSYGIWASASLGNNLLNWNFNQVELFGQQLGGAMLSELQNFTFANLQILLTVNGTAFQLNNSFGGSLTQSYIQNDVGGSGLHFDNVGTLANPVLVVNNRLSIGGNGVDRKGLFITNGSDGLNLLHNSIYIHGDNLATHYAIEMDGVGANNLIENNLFVKSTTGPAAKATAIADLAGSNFNDYYSTGGNLMEANALTYLDLAAWQLASGGDGQSLNIDPLFASVTDLRVAAIPLKQAGNNQGITTDFEGDARTVATPDLGADEFLPQIYDNLLNSCVTFDPVVSTGSGEWIYLYADRELVAAINDQGNILGTISGEVYVNTAAIRLDSDGNRYLDRNWHISTTNVPATPVSVRLYFLNDELTDLMVVDPLVTGPGDLSVTRYSGNNENCDLNDNQPFPGAPYQVYGPGVNVNGNLFGVDYFVQSDVENFSEFYLNSTGVVLPLEIQHFRAELVSGGVALTWGLPKDVFWQKLEVIRTGKNQVQEPIATLTPDQYLSGQHSFSFLDEDALTFSGSTLEYQLRVKDQNGSSYLSQVEQVLIGGSQWSMKLAPNPAKSSAFVHLDQVERFTPVEIEVFDLHGRLVWEKQLEMDNSNTQQELPIAEWGKGIFLVKVSIAGKRQIRRLSIQ